MKPHEALDGSPRKTNAERVLELLRNEGEPLDDDEIAARLGIRSRQQVHQICSRLAAEGLIRRESMVRLGKRRKIHNVVERRSRPRENDRRAFEPRWRRRLRLLEAATGRPEEELLDEALGLLARKLVAAEVGGGEEGLLDRKEGSGRLTIRSPDMSETGKPGDGPGEGNGGP